eukprot:gb/GFBE01000033.1/.p1 GENE.gb/GFBE01000033.1/~~gb/GFBE01000033.1/.p1  ORF type:complete len:509 (+),score=55.76 gb/GFBE01000033.1/:1-1527(+)
MAVSEHAALPTTGLGSLLKDLVEVGPTFLIAGFGMVVAGCLLDSVQNWPVFQEVTELLIMVPALLGLKGNLEMTLGARLGSYANNKKLDGEEFWPIVTSNLMAIQCQAIVVGFVAALIATFESYVSNSVWSTPDFLLLCASAVTAASLASFILSVMMISIVLMARRFGIDPDNITAPIAGMLGDFCTLGLLSGLATGFWYLPAPLFDGLFILLLVYFVVAAICGYYACKSEYTIEIMKYGWYPVLASMMLSACAGTIMERALARFPRMASFSPVMNGGGGNLGSILASKLSTDLAEARSDLLGEDYVPVLPVALGTMRKSIVNLSRISGENLEPLLAGPYKQPSLMSIQETARDSPFSKKQAHTALRTSWIDMTEERSPKHYAKEWLTLHGIIGEGEMRRFTRLLLFLCVPGSVIFSGMIVGVQSRWSALPTPLFLIAFVTAAFIQVCILIMAARTAVVIFWEKEIDPDNCVSPLVCGLGDLVGTAFLSLAFCFLAHEHGEPWSGSGL